MANTKNMRDIEIRLLKDVNKDWSNIVIEVKFKDSSSMLKYIRLMEFLFKEKNCVMYLIRTLNHG